MWLVEVGEAALVRKWRHHQLWELGASRETHRRKRGGAGPLLFALQVSTSSDQCLGKKLRSTCEYRK